jgi:tryptophan 2,3-dioxygenase
LQAQGITIAPISLSSDWLVRPLQLDTKMIDTSLESTLQNIDDWAPSPREDAFPYRDVLRELRRRGKHFADAELLSKLDWVRSEILPTVHGTNQQGGVASTLKTFLRVALDKRDGTYDYTTYIAVDLLGLPMGGIDTPPLESSRRLHDATVVSLICDALRFEIDAASGHSNSLPEMRPDASLFRKRLEVGLKVLAPALQRLGLDSAADDPARIADIIDFARRCPLAVPEPAMGMTMLPVYVVHDEYLFIRILQALEATFAWIAVHLEAAGASFRMSGAEVVGHLSTASVMLKEGSRLFLLLGTMQKKSFETFRMYTEGASAIQSTNYKRMESICRMPDEGRLESIAYASVPRVQKVVARASRCRSLRPDSYVNLDDARLEARKEGRLSPELDQEIQKGMSHFATALRSWKFAHYSIAVKMLGRGTGTGYTEGTPYLRDVREIPVFASLGEWS